MRNAFYRRQLPHLQRDYRPHFITFCTNKKWTLPESARQIVLDCCVHDHDRTIALYVSVVMPDHVHMIFTPLINRKAQEIYSLASIMDAIKGASSHKINRLLGGKGRVWQAESFDHVLRSSESLDAKVGYILANPVRAGLVTKWEDYPMAVAQAGSESILPALLPKNYLGTIASHTMWGQPPPAVRGSLLTNSPKIPIRNQGLLAANICEGITLSATYNQQDSRGRLSPHGLM